MHEFSLMADLFRKIDSISQDNEQAKILVVRVKLGALSHITPTHFSEHFNEFSNGTVAEGAMLEVIQLEDKQDPNAQDIILDSVELAA
jgi:hydrogenase nickel incorporation protein HypA/HybF